MHINLIVGSRSDFMKAAPVAEALHARRPDWRVRTIHTGRHYDEKLAEVFFAQLGMPEPELNLEIGSGSHTFQAAHIMLALEGQFRRERPDLVVVFGDVSSTLGAALVAAQLRIPLAHVEAGLRSYDREVPEENNRVVTDAISDLLFVTERGAEQNLRNEGIAHEKIHFVGNTMIDTLLKHRKAARALCVPEVLGLRAGNYVVVRLHRPSNVDSEHQLRSVVYALQSLADHADVVFLAHPRTVQRLRDYRLWDEMDRQGRLRVMKTLGYLEFIGLMDSASALLTDSGEIQEEAIVLGVPCVTLQKTTERPVTILGGGNRLAGQDPHLAVRYVREAISQAKHLAPIPEGWDGRAGSRVVDVLEREVAGSAAQVAV